MLIKIKARLKIIVRVLSIRSDRNTPQQATKLAVAKRLLALAHDAGGSGA